ncbi:mechanosensitive ion channel domain-containing protein [Mycolicibacterium bacteremicum]|uniref:mechanosensitive ion channel domain-containing protein n=1 Tax=Mycolicibacterium bacteremicum TaxID=564198 RepID=UPI0026EDBBC2|nr:mechanosensitive ion channel family protein [Mycolicibacterium bacteremicum]
MSELLSAPWFAWAIGISIGLPLALVVLTEVRNALLRRGKPLAGAIGLLRNYLLPLGALLLLLTKANEVSANTTPVRIIATVFGFVVLILLLSGLNATLFQGAPEQSWRKRIPSIFLDVARFAVIAVGLALIFSYVWGANVGGLFTALGITSIVLGLALQNSVGQIVSGLLLLFEQPFRLGDWLDTPTARGRVIEVNWRATHIDTRSGMQIIPNSVLAGAAFTNMSRPPGQHSITVVSVFAIEDSPDAVCAVLSRMANALPQLHIGHHATAVPLGGLEYQTTIPLRSPSDDAAARSTFLRWIWYAARRAELHLDEADDDFAGPEHIDEAMSVVASSLRLTAEETEALSPLVRLARYGVQESMQAPGQVPTRMTFIVRGRVQLTAVREDGVLVTVRVAEEGDFLGQTALTREPVTTGAQALDEVTVVQIDRVHVERLVARKPLLLQEIGRAIEERQLAVQQALAASD